MSSAQKPDTRKPDYIGSWGTTYLEELTSYPCPHQKLPEGYHEFFHLFIDQTTPTEDKNTKHFIGRALDTHGWADCTGTISPDRFNFNKKYSKEAIADGANSGELNYQGVRYTSGNGTSLAEVCAGVIIGKELSSPLAFVMISRSNLTEEFPFG